jgi:hypothetical protein
VGSGRANGRITGSGERASLICSNGMPLCLYGKPFTVTVARGISRWAILGSNQ